MLVYIKIKRVEAGILNIKTLAAYISKHMPANEPYLIGIDGLAGSGIGECKFEGNRYIYG